MSPLRRTQSPYRSAPRDLLTDPLFKNARQRRAACRNWGPLLLLLLRRRYARRIQGRLRCAFMRFARANARLSFTLRAPFTV